MATSPPSAPSWHEGSGGEPGRLDVDVVLGEDRRIEESFAGVGGAEAGCRDALDAFEQNAFHLLLAACWYVTDDRRMRIAAWDIGVRTWDVFIGPFQLRGADDRDLAMPHDATDRDRGRLAAGVADTRAALAAPGPPHGDDGDMRCEALLDNEPWTAGTLALDCRGLAGGRRQIYSARCFVMLDCARDLLIGLDRVRSAKRKKGRRWRPFFHCRMTGQISSAAPVVQHRLEEARRLAAGGGAVVEGQADSGMRRCTSMPPITATTSWLSLPAPTMATVGGTTTGVA